MENTSRASEYFLALFSLWLGFCSLPDDSTDRTRDRPTTHTNTIRLATNPTEKATSRVANIRTSNHAPIPDGSRNSVHQHTPSV